DYGSAVGGRAELGNPLDVLLVPFLVAPGDGYVLGLRVDRVARQTAAEHGPILAVLGRLRGGHRFGQVGRPRDLLTATTGAGNGAAKNREGSREQESRL